MAEDQKLLLELTKLIEARQLPLAEVDVSPEQLRHLGFRVDASEVSCPSDIEWLESPQIRSGLTRRANSWLRELNVFPLIGSTSSLLLERARKESIEGVVNTAELQIAGRGRRGRMWQSPLGQNLAFSAGLLLPLVPAAMGGFSLCIGLAILDVLQQAGVPGVQLKWPNDVLMQGHKLAGVLVDLNTHADGCEVVVGIGLNLQLPAETTANIDQPVANLAAAEIKLSRNRLLAALLSSIVDYAEGFAESGFGPMRSTFDNHHAFQNQECRILLGREYIVGIVRGVTASGELLLDTASGMQAFAAGEVSLRPQL